MSRSSRDRVVSLVFMLAGACSTKAYYADVPFPPVSQAETEILLIDTGRGPAFHAYGLADKTRIELDLGITTDQRAHAEALLYHETLHDLGLAEGVINSAMGSPRGLPGNAAGYFALDVGAGRMLAWTPETEPSDAAKAFRLPVPPCLAFTRSQPILFPRTRLPIGLVRTPSRLIALFGDTRDAGAYAYQIDRDKADPTPIPELTVPGVLALAAAGSGDGTIWLIAHGTAVLGNSLWSWQEGSAGGFREIAVRTSTAGAFVLLGTLGNRALLLANDGSIDAFTAAGEATHMGKLPLPDDCTPNRYDFGRACDSNFLGITSTTAGEALIKRSQGDSIWRIGRGAPSKEVVSDDPLASVVALPSGSAYAGSIHGQVKRRARDGTWSDAFSVGSNCVVYDFAEIEGGDSVIFSGDCGILGEHNAGGLCQVYTLFDPDYEAHRMVPTETGLAVLGAYHPFEDMLQQSKLFFVDVQR